MMMAVMMTMAMLRMLIAREGPEQQRARDEGEEKEMEEEKTKSSNSGKQQQRRCRRGRRTRRPTTGADAGSPTTQLRALCRSR